MSANRVFQLGDMGRLNKLGCLGHRSIITLSSICSETILKVVKHRLRTLLAGLLADLSRSKCFLTRLCGTYMCGEQCKEPAQEKAAMNPGTVLIMKEQAPFSFNQIYSRCQIFSGRTGFVVNLNI